MGRKYHLRSRRPITNVVFSASLDKKIRILTMRAKVKNASDRMFAIYMRSGAFFTFATYRCVIYYFIRKMKVRLLSFAQNRILFNNSEDVHTTMSIKTHLHIKATRLFSTQEIYNKNFNARYMYV